MNVFIAGYLVLLLIAFLIIRQLTNDFENTVTLKVQWLKVDGSLPDFGCIEPVQQTPKNCVCLFATTKLNFIAFLLSTLSDWYLGLIFDPHILRIDISTKLLHFSSLGVCGQNQGQGPLTRTKLSANTIRSIHSIVAF